MGRRWTGLRCEERVKVEKEKQKGQEQKKMHARKVLSST